MISQGAAALAGSGKTQEEIAERLKISRSLVSMWLCHRRVPSKAHRKAVREAYGIAEGSWDAPAKRARAVAAAAPVVLPTDTSVNGRVAMLHAMIDEAIASSRAPGTSPAEKAKTAQRAAATLAILARITGESAVIDEAKLVKLPALRRVFDALIEALTPWPEAMRAAGEALAVLDGAKPRPMGRVA